MSVFRPSARVRLTLRTEEFAETADLEARLAPATSTAPYEPEASALAPQDPRTLDATALQQRLQQTQQAARALESNAGLLTPEDFQAQRQELREEREDLQRAADNFDLQADLLPLRPPEAVTGTPPDDLTITGSIEPLSVQLERNGLDAADTCTITLDGIDAPFDPRVLRSAHVEVVIGVVNAFDYQQGTEFGRLNPDGSLRSLVERRQDGSIEGATRFVGFVDDWAVRYSDQGDVITLECRDMSANLRDEKMNTGESINMSLPIDQGVRDLIQRVSPSSRGVEVIFEGEGDPPAPGSAQPPRRRPRRGRGGRRARRGNQQMAVWDHITDVCRAAGFIPMIRDFAIVIAEARTLFGTQSTRRMIYGQNISELNFTRRLQGTRVPIIEVRAYDPAIGRTRWARYPTRAGLRTSGIFGETNPPRASRANNVTPSGANPSSSIRTIVVSGVVDPNVLERIAQNAFEQIGRQEIEGTFSTKEVSSYDRSPIGPRSPEAADLLQLNPGDGVEVLIVASAPTDVDAPTLSQAELQAFSVERRRDYLIGLGWPEDVATRFAVLQESSGYQTVFRTQDVRISWDHEQGVSIEAGFVNYITVREDEDT